MIRAWSRRRLAMALVVTAGAMGAAISTASSAAAADDFGQHVSICAKTMGFNGEHNPGMHQGFAGWDPSHQC